MEESQEITGLGVDPSIKYRSLCLIPFSTNLFLSYRFLLSLMTVVIPCFLKIGT